MRLIDGILFVFKSEAFRITDVAIILIFIVIFAICLCSLARLIKNFLGVLWGKFGRLRSLACFILFIS